MGRATIGRLARALGWGLALLVGTMLATGASASAASEPVVLGWGVNEAHELSDGTTVNRATPVEVQGLPEEVVGLSAGSGASAALLRGGGVMTWGENLSNLGSGTEGSSLVPTPVCDVGATHCDGGPYLDGVGSISGGGSVYLALRHDGSVVSWGFSQPGQLGQRVAQSPVPGLVCTVWEYPCDPAHELKQVTAIAAGQNHSLALLEDGTVLAWGDNSFGELGVTKTAVKCAHKGYKCSYLPIPVPGLSEVTSIAAGDGFSLALTRRGTVMAWGSNVYGTLGNGRTETAKVATPAPVCASWVKTRCKGELSEVAAIAVDGDTAFAVMRDGSVRAWGLNQQGLLGIAPGTEQHGCPGSSECSSVPVTVAGLDGVRTMASGGAVGSQTALAQLQDDTFVTWGSGYLGTLGDGQRESSFVPVHVCAPFAAGPCPEGPYLTGAATAIAAGGAHVLVSIFAE